ncbi:MAG: hypothetical protein Q9221_005273 [Calogaya cf. arnoldii]
MPPPTTLKGKLQRPLDTTHIKQQHHATRVYLMAMKDKGFNLSNVDEFERLMKDDASLKQWMDEQLESGKEELAVKEDEIAMKEADARDFAQTIADSSEAIDYWDTKAEDVIGDDAKAIKEMIKENPVLATKIMEDGAVNKIVQSRLEEGQKLIEEMSERFDKLEEKFMKTVNERVDSLELPQRLESYIDKLQQVLRIGESTATFNETAIKELEERIVAKDDEIVEYTDSLKMYEQTCTEQVTKIETLEDSVTELKSELSRLRLSAAGDRTALVTSKQQVNDLKTRESELETDLSNSTMEVSSLKRQLGDIEVDLRTSKGNNTTLRKSIEDKDKALDEHRMEIQTLKQSAADTQRLLDDATQEKLDLSGRNKALTEEVGKHKEEKLDLYGQNKALTDQVGEQKEKLNEVIGDRDYLSGQVDTYEQVAFGKDQEIEGLKETLASTQKDKDDLTSQLAEARSNASEAAQQAKRELESVQQSNSELQSVKDDLTSQLTVARSRASEAAQQAKQRIADLKGDLANVHRSNKELQSDKDKLEEEKEALTSELTETKSEASQEIARVQQELEVVLGDLAASQKSTTGVREEKDKLEEEKRALETRLAETESNASQDIARVQQELQVVIGDLATKQKSITGFEADKVNLEKAMAALETRLTEEKSDLENRLTEEKSDLETRLIKEKSEFSRALQVKDGELAKKTADNEVTRQLVCALAGVSTGSDFTDSMVRCQTRSMAIYNASAKETSQPLPMPHMVFEEDGANLDPTSHAIRFWSAVQSGRVAFPDSQALFNVDTIGSELAGVYPWILDSLTLAISQMEPVPWTVAIFKKMLTVLQGIAYLGYLVQALRIPGDEVQALTRQAENFLVAQNLLQAGSILQSVFNSVKLALQGDTISTWLTEQGNRLDDSNCGLIKRCIAADDATPGNFVLLDQLEDQEILYAFSIEEVSSVDNESATDRMYLHFSDMLVSRRVGHRLFLEFESHLNMRLNFWVDKFLPGKYIDY